jgi:prepilin-type processing-associated H-X9-DG protein
MPASPVINANEGSLGSLSQPSSPHTGGAVVAFCDGHTRFVSDTLDPAVYANLLNWRNTLSSAVGQAWVLRTQILDDSQY